MKKKKRSPKKEEDFVLFSDEDDGFDDLLDEVEDSLSDLLDDPDSHEASPAGASPKTLLARSGHEEMESTFLDILRNNLRPVTRYMKALENGKNYPELYEIIDMTVSPVAQQAERAELHDLSRILSDIADQCQDAAKINGDKAARERFLNELKNRFRELTARVDLPCRGHVPAVINLLRFYQRVRSDSLLSYEDVQRFFALGIPSVSWVCRTPAGEIVNLSGISPTGVRHLKSLARRSQRRMGFHGAGLNLSNLFRLNRKI